MGALACLVALLAPALVAPASGQGLLESFLHGVRAQSAYTRGKALYDAGDYRAARQRLAEAVALEPIHDEAQALLAWSHYHLGDYRAAVIAFKTVLRRQPAWEGLHDGLGWSRLRLRRYHLAVEAFQAALDRSPDYTDALVGLGSAHFELGRYETALPSFRKALGNMATLLGPEPPEAQSVRAKIAWSLYYLGRHREALGEFERALRSAPDGHGLHNGVGWALLRLGERAQARAAFQRALALRPGYADALEGLRLAGS